MSEGKEVEIENMFEGKELTPQVRLSPTAINTFFKCPRNYFYHYILKLKTESNLHLIKGIAVHKTLEDFFRTYKAPFRKTMEDYFEKAWKSQEKAIKDLEFTDEEKSEMLRDCYGMIDSYLINFEQKCNRIIEAGKAENAQHAFYLLKPKFREMWVENKDLHCCGFIDRVDKDFDGIITLGDYKTSKKYGIGMPMDYKRQLSIYALLYNLQTKELPDFVSVIFLRYGEEYFLEVTPSLLKYARDTILDVYGKTRSIDIEDYPVLESPLCRWCDFSEYCDGTKEYEDKKRIKNLKSHIKKHKI